MSDYTTCAERAHIAAVNAGEADAERRAARLADLELSPLADLLKAALAYAERALESRTADADTKRLAEMLIDMHGPADDCHTLRNAIA